MASQDWFEKDFYAILGVAQDADAKEITKTYRKAARKYHPDSNPGDQAAEQKFKEIGEAYAVLSDPEQRKQYDAVRSMARGGARFTSGGGPGAAGAGFEDVFSNFFSQGGGAAGAGAHYRQYGGGFPGSGAGGSGPTGGNADFEDLLSMFQNAGAAGGGAGGAGGFGRGGRGGFPGFGEQSTPRKGRDRQASATLSFRQAVAGDVVEIRGTDGGTSKARIPAGVRDGQTIRIRGKGDPGPSGTPAGDLLIRVSVTPHEVFGREGDNLTVDVPVTPAEAALGATISVPTFDGSPVKVKIAPGTPAGRVLRVKGRGVTTGNGSGDLLVTVDIAVPQRLTDKAREAYEVIRAEDEGEDPREGLFRRAAS